MDRLTNLPDPLRNRIICLLPLEDIIKTTILSKAWSNVSTSLTTLNFHQPTYERKSRRFPRPFKDFVYQTLTLLDGFDIENFTLTVDLQNLSPSHVYSWVSFAITRNIKIFHLFVISGDVGNLPFSLFTSKTLEDLRLENITLRLPTRIGFPKLQCLKLTSVGFLDQNLTNHLFANCPLLQDLFISNCFFEDISKLRITGDNLKSFTLLDCYQIPDIEISAKNLHEIKYHGNPPDVCFETLASLLHLEFQTPSSARIIAEQRDKYFCRARDIVMGLQNVVTLALRGFYIEFLTRSQSSLACMPTFGYRLERLQLDVYPTKNQIQVIILLLRNYPNLKHLHISVQEQCSSRIILNMNGDWQLQEMHSEMSLHNLKTVDIVSFEGTENELDLVRHLIEKAGVLEKMKIVLSRQMIHDAMSLVSINEKIGAFDKASPNVVISITLA